MTKNEIALTIAFAFALFFSGVAKAQTYGPVEPKAFTYPKVFTVQPDESTEEAQAKVERKRRDATRWEIAYQVLNIADTAETIDCLNRHVCTEGNPILRYTIGKRPSAGSLIATKGAFGLVHWLVFAKKRRDDPDAALKMAKWSVFIQGSVVAVNARFVF